MGSLAPLASAYAWYPHHGGYYPHGGYYHRDRFASGLVVGGLMGLMAGSVIASHSYEPPTCYQEPVWTHEFCDRGGCYERTAWREVCR